MGNILAHSESSAKHFGGKEEDYAPIHKFLDQTKLYIPDWRHRCILHNNFGIALCEQFFGDFYTRPSDGVKVCIRTVVEQHIKEDLNCIPTLELMLHEMPIRPWMSGLKLPDLFRMQNLKIGGKESNDKLPDSREAEL